MGRMIKQRLESVLHRRCTLLGVGPMSLNCVNAAIELANEHLIPIMLIASRGQIDSEKFGGGYVNNWTTEGFASYVIDNDKNGRVILARDHGGPWQNTREKEAGLSLRRAMESAKSSFRADIESGFQVLHIDPSIDIHGTPTLDEVLERIFELYEYCWAQAQRLGVKILFEIGTEEQSGSTNTQEELEYTLKSMRRICDRNALPFPSFVVVQTGTRVIEKRNVGSFDSPIRIMDELPAEIQVPKMIEICNRNNIFMKAHNTDYLSNEALQWYPRLGIHSANVAPEFGVAETLALLKLMEEEGMDDLVERFLQLAYDANKWHKWVLPGNHFLERDCAVVGGHYVFATEECREIKLEVQSRIHHKHIDLEDFLKEHVKKSIMRYLHNFRLVRTV
jgi:tagatose-1,6-bisphosphate aldolase non-catalytic subunit AgaZ/GatZ